MDNKPDKESKTLPATEHKIRQATEKGNTPFSKEVSGFTGLVAAIVTIYALSGDGLLSLGQSLGLLLDNAGQLRFDNAGNVTAFLYSRAMSWLYYIAPIILTFTLAGVIAAVSQNPPRLVIDRIKPDPSRLSLKKGFGRLFGANGAVEFLKALAKFSIIAAVGMLMAFGLLKVAIGSMFSDPLGLPNVLRDSLIKLFLGICIASLFLALADIAWSKFRWLEELKMTRQEVKDEQKQLEGEQSIKAKMRSAAMMRNRRRMLADVPLATLVIANPTHYSVALRYNPQVDVAPIVVAKGKDHLALRIRETAEKHEVPVFEERELARSLYAVVEISQEIPPEFYKAVAELVIYVKTKRAPSVG